MKLRILGCSGGIGGSLRTTSMLLDNDILIEQTLFDSGRPVLIVPYIQKTPLKLDRTDEAFSATLKGVLEKTIEVVLGGGL